jgi:hypothetical protein
MTTEPEQARPWKPRRTVRGLEWRITAYTVSNEAATPDEIAVALQKDGLRAEPATIKTQMQRTKRVLVVLRELGLRP